MANHGKLRKQVLLSAHRRSNGDPQASVDLTRIAKDVQLPMEELEVIARQLADKGLVKAEIPDIYNGGGSLTMTIQGIEEAEKAQERRDIVEEVTESARKHPLTAFAIIGLFVLTSFVALINQAIQLMKNLGWIGQ